MRIKITLLLILIVMISWGCNKNESFYKMKELKGELRIVKTEFDNSYKFGDCFLYEYNREKFILLVVSKNANEYVAFLPIDASSLKDLDSNSIKLLSVTYYSQKPSFIDIVLGGEIPYGGYTLSFERNNEEMIHELKNKLKYLYTINLDEQKEMQKGGSVLLPQDSMLDVIKMSLDKENKQVNSSLVIEIPLQNLCSKE